jgi:hypothetical protein
LLARYIATAGHVYLLALEGTAAIEIHRSLGVHLPGNLFSFAKGAWRVGVELNRKKQGEQKQAVSAHGVLDD